MKSDIEMFNQTLKELGGQPEETFMCVLAPGWLEHSIWNDYYKTDEEYLFALADAMRPSTGPSSMPASSCSSTTPACLTPTT